MKARCVEETLRLGHKHIITGWSSTSSEGFPRKHKGGVKCTQLLVVRGKAARQLMDAVPGRRYS